MRRRRASQARPQETDFVRQEWLPAAESGPRCSRSAGRINRGRERGCCSAASRAICHRKMETRCRALSATSGLRHAALAGAGRSQPVACWGPWRPGRRNGSAAADPFPAAANRSCGQIATDGCPPICSPWLVRREAPVRHAASGANHDFPDDLPVPKARTHDGRWLQRTNRDAERRWKYWTVSFRS